MALVSSIRYYPIEEKSAAKAQISYNRPNIDYQIDNDLENLILRHISSLSIDDLGIITGGLYKSRVLIGRENTKLVQSYVDVILKLNNDSLIHHQYAISNIIKMLTTRDFSIRSDQIEPIMQKYVPNMPSFNFFLIIRYVDLDSYYKHTILLKLLSLTRSTRYLNILLCITGWLISFLMHFLKIQNTY